MKNLILLVALLYQGMAVFSQEAKFTYQYHNSQIKAGRFVFIDPEGTLSVDVDASAGYLVASNNPYYQATKNVGPIPNGTWEIYAIKSETKYTLRLRATGDVAITTRDGFLIHGVGEDSTPEEASRGCIIITDRESRKKLVAAFKKYGIIKVKVTNIVTSNGTES